MNVEPIHSSSSSSSDNEDRSDKVLAKNGRRTSGSSPDIHEVRASSTSSGITTHPEELQAITTKEPNDRDRYSSSSSTQSSVYEEVEGYQKHSASPRHSDQDSPQIDKKSYESSITTESGKELLRSILSDSSSDRVLTDIEVTSPKDGASSTDDELLQRFREQQANRRYRPKSAKLKYKKEVGPETVQKVPSRGSDKDSDKASDSSDSSTVKSNTSSNRAASRLKKRSASSSSHDSRQKRTPQRSTSTSASLDSEPAQKPSDIRRASTSANSSSASTLISEELVPSQAIKSKRKPGSREDSAGISRGRQPYHIPRAPATPERPVTRRGRDPRQSTRVGRPATRSKPVTEKKTAEVLWKYSEPAAESRSNWPKEPGFWWPYNEDCGDAELRKLISYHRRKLKNLLAQEYLQRHLELELKKAGAKSKRYDRGVRPLSAKQIRKYKERDVSWIYLDGKLFSLNQDSMGMLLGRNKGDSRNKVGTQKTRSASRSMERSSKSSERSKRSVSFEKGAGRKGAKGARKAKNKHRSRSSSRESRRSSLSSRGSSKRSRGSSKSSRTESRSGSRSSSRNTPKRSSNKPAAERQNQPARPKSALRRPKTAKSKLRSVSSTSRSSTDMSWNKNEKKRNSSTESGKIRSKSRESGRTSRSGSRSNKGDKALERVLFTEEFEKKLRRKERNSANKIKNERTPKKKTSSCEETREKPPATAPPASAKQGAPRDDYSFYKDPNVPGHAFPQYYLAQLLSSQSRRGRKNYENTEYVLLPAPVKRPPAWKSHSKRQGRPRTAPVSSARAQPRPPQKPRRKKKKCVITQSEATEKPASRDSSSSSSRSDSPQPTSHPRIRPGSGPIKCSWRAHSEEKPKFGGSDHQLKNTDNPAVLNWLRHKDAQMRARRQNEVRQHRRKTAKLIDEQNELEDKHERALKQYEIWKKNKDREILLRRRKEAKEANSASFGMSQERSSHSRSGNYSHHNSTFSELRSSSARPATAEEKLTQRKARPKSANVSGISVSADFEVKRRPKSTNPSQTRGQPDSSQPEQGFFKKFLEEDGKNRKRNSKNVARENKKSLVDDESSKNGDRADYNRWVRSSPPGTKKKSKKTKKSKRLPAHNHADNELISSLAKRRIDNILASKKQVDTGLNKRPKSGTSRSKSPASEAAHSKWKLREDDVVKPSVSFAGDARISSSDSSGCAVSKSDGERPKFDYRKKSPASPSRHHRNPVVRDAINSTLSDDKARN